MENRIAYLPLGSVVLLKHATKKVIIVGRGLKIKHKGEEVFFDYAAARYPEGIEGDQLAYFNHDSIAKIVFEGFADDDNTIIVDNINHFLSENEVKRGNAEEMRS